MGNEQQSTEGGNLQDRELSKEGIIDLLNQEDDEDVKPPKGEEEEKPTVEEEDEEDKEGDEEGEEDKEDKEEIELKDEDEEVETEDKLVTPFRKKELLAKYPKILKEFPYIERSYYRDQQFTETFATPAEAKEAAERLQGLEQFEQEWGRGNIENVITAIKENDKKAYAKLVDNFLPQLEKADPEAHLHVMGGVVKNIILTLARHGKSTDNDELRKAALAINRYFFESDEFVPQPKLSTAKESDEEDDEVESERETWTRERFETSRDDLDTRVENVLKSTITHHIDQKNQMTDYVRKTAIKDSLEEVKNILDQDVTFRKHLDTLWRRAFETGFKKTSLDAIKSAYLSKAKTVLPQVIRKTRAVALKGSGVRVRREAGDEPTTRRGHMPPSRSSSSSTERGHKKLEVPKGMSTLDYLNQD